METPVSTTSPRHGAPLGDDFLGERRAALRPRPGSEATASTGLDDVALVFARRIEAAGDEAQRHHLIEAALRHLGFDWLAFGDIELASGTLRPLSCPGPLAHPGWTRQYLSRGYTACDPRHAALARSQMPYVWGLDRLHLEGLATQADTALLREFLGGLDRHGLRSGIVLSVTHADPGRRCFASFAARRHGSGWIDAACLGAALTLGLALAPVVAGLVPAQLPAPSAPIDAPDVHALSGTQREILGCLRSGMSDKQIAYTLNVTRHNVDYHMRQLRRRFGARNRLQLAQRVECGGAVI